MSDKAQRDSITKTIIGLSIIVSSILVASLSALFSPAQAQTKLLGKSPDVQLECRQKDTGYVISACSFSCGQQFARLNPTPVPGPLPPKDPPDILPGGWSVYTARTLEIYTNGANGRQSTMTYVVYSTGDNASSLKVQVLYFGPSVFCGWNLESLNSNAVTGWRLKIFDGAPVTSP